MEILQVRVVLCGPFGSRPSRHVILYCSVEVYWTTHRERAGSCVAPVPSATFTAKHAHTCPGNWPERLNYEVTANPLQPRSDRTGKGRGPADERIRSRLRRASNQYKAARTTSFKFPAACGRLLSPCPTFDFGFNSPFVRLVSREFRQPRTTPEAAFRPKWELNRCLH